MQSVRYGVPQAVVTKGPDSRAILLLLIFKDGDLLGDGM